MAEILNPTIPKMLSTAEAAACLCRAPQTLRMWASQDNGPIRPVRVNGFGGPLLWREEDILEILRRRSGAIVKDG